MVRVEAPGPEALPGTGALPGAQAPLPVAIAGPAGAPVVPNVNVVFTLASRRATFLDNSLLLEGVAPIATFVATEPILNAGACVIPVICWIVHAASPLHALSNFPFLSSALVAN